MEPAAPLPGTAGTATPVSRELVEITDEEWAIAAHRFELLQPLLTLWALPKEEVRQVARLLSVNVATIYRWMVKLKHTNQVSSLLLSKRGMKDGHVLIDAAVEVIIQEEIEQSYLNELQLSAKTVARRIFLKCRELGYDLPSEGTIRNRIRRLPPSTQVERRMGKKAARERFHPKTGHLPGADYPYALVEIDHTPLDLILVDDIHRQPIGRPYLTLAIDVFSRTVAGFHLSLEAPSATSVALCLAHAILPKDLWCMERKLPNAWRVEGLMDCVHCDNGPEFHSKALRRACEQYGIRLQHRPVREPHYGGHIERLLGTYAMEIHVLPGTTKSNPAERGEYESEKHACMTLQECESWLAEFTTGVYHQRVHSALGVSPLVKYQQGRPVQAEDGQKAPRACSDEQRLRLDFLPYFERVVQPTGVHIDGIDYYHDVLRTWIGAPDPADPNARRKFVVRRDPRNISRIYFYDPELQQYFEIPYRDNTHPVMSLWELRSLQQNLRQQGREQTDEDAVFDSLKRLRDQQELAAEKTLSARRAVQRRRVNTGTESAAPEIRSSSADEPAFAGPPPEPFADIEEFRHERL